MKEKIKSVIYIAIFVIFMIFCMVGYKILLNNQTTVNEKETDNTVNQADNRKLPKFEVYINENEKINVESLIGKPIVINIWTSWCAYCDVEMAYFNELYLKEKDNIHFLMINATGDRDSIENANNFIDKNGYDFKPYYDLKLDALKSLGIYSYPTTIFIDSNGYIDSVKIGVITKEELKNKIEMLK